MTPTKILFGQLAITLSLFLLGMWSATQWVALNYDYSSLLGISWTTVESHSVYAPWQYFIWLIKFGDQARDLFVQGGLVILGCIGTAAAASIYGSVSRARTSDVVTTYGSAKWATRKEIRQSNLLATSGVFLGQTRKGEGKQHYLRDNADTHILGFAPTRSGKGVGLVVPTLLTWPGSVVVHDIKGENWHLTSGWRSKFSTTLCFDPTSLSSVRFNPLMEIRKGVNEVRDTQNVIDIMIDPQGMGVPKNHWDKTSNDLMVAIILHVLYAEPDKSMWGLAKFMSDPSRPFDEMLELMKATYHLDDRPHPIVAHGAQQAINMTPNEFSGVLSTAMTLLGLYRDPIVQDVTCQSDFTIAELVNGDKPMSLYFVVPPSDISRTRPLIRLMLNQILRRKTEKLDVTNENAHRLLLMLDEFPALGRLDFFESALGFIAGYGIKAYLISQSLNQIEKVYGTNNAVMDNCQIRIAFAANDDRTAKRISDSLGTCTQQRSQRNFAGHRLNMWLGHMMVSTQETSRPLLTPGEVMQLPSDEAIVMVAGTAPIKAGKLRYYKDRHFSTRIIPPVVQQQRELRDLYGGQRNPDLAGFNFTGTSDHEAQGRERDKQAHIKQTQKPSENDISDLITETDNTQLTPAQAEYLSSLDDDMTIGMGGTHG